MHPFCNVQTKLGNKGPLSTCAGNGDSEQFARRISPEFSSRKTHIQKKNHQLLNLPTYSRSDFYGPPIMLPWTSSKKSLPFCNTAKWPPEGMRHAGFHESTAGNQGKTLGFKARALVFQEFMLWDLRGAEHFSRDKRPAMSQRGAHARPRKQGCWHEHHRI